MRRYIRRARPALCSCITLALVFLSLGALNNQAQTSREARVNKSIETRQRDLANLERRRDLPPKPRDHRLLYQQLKEDFVQLQLINNHLSTLAGSTPTLDYEHIRKDVAEVNRLAARLKANFSLPEPEKGEKPKKEPGDFTPEAFKSALKALNSLVKSFVENPVFQQLQVIDVEYSTRASRDLEGIIRLSEQLHKRAEILNKAAGKSL